MTPFKINLIRDRVPPPAVRRRRYWMMIAYLVATGVWMVAVAHQATGRVVTARRMDDARKDVLGTFRARHAGSDNPARVAAALQRRMEDDRGSLQAVSKLVADGIPTADVCLAIVAALPADAQIIRLDYDRERGGLEFDLNLPTDEEAEAPDAAGLIGLWYQDPCLRQHLADLILQGSSRQRTTDGTMHVLRFKCRVKTGG